MDIINEIKQAKLSFAKQGLFNTKTEFDFVDYCHTQLPRAPIWKGYWNIYPASIDNHNMWNLKWCDPEYNIHRNGRIKSVFLKDSNVAYKSHCVQRIFERNGFDPANLPKNIESTDWIEYMSNESSLQDMVEQRFPIPFLDGILIVSKRLGMFGTKVKCHSKGVKGFNDVLGQKVYVAWTYIENLNEAQETTLFYINNNQFQDAKDKFADWIKNYEHDALQDTSKHHVMSIDQIRY